jgi:dolichyl-phosphate-mannose-protein mannosyltransferase
MLHLIGETPHMQLPRLQWLKLNGRGTPRIGLIALLLAGLIVRMLVINLPGHEGDIGGFTTWAKALLAVPFSDFYSTGAPESDSLPGYLYLLAITANARTVLSGPISKPEDFAVWIKVFPILADLLLAYAVFRLCRLFGNSRTSLVAAALIIFNPAIIFVSAVWGQIDSISTALATLCGAALLSGNPLVAALLAGLAFVTKPQYVPFLIPLAAAYLRRETLHLPSIVTSGGMVTWARWLGMRVMLPLAIATGTVQACLLPFSVSIWPIPGVRWTLAERLGIAHANFPVASVNAFNLWGTPIAKVMQTPDSTVGWLSMSYETWGILLVTAVGLISLAIAWKRASDLSLVLWSGFVFSYGFFVLFTRIHERYLYIAIPLLATVAILRRSTRWCYYTVSALYLMNLWWVYATSQSGWLKNTLMKIPELVSVPSILNVAILLGCLAAMVAMATQPLLAIRSQSDSTPLPVQPDAATRQ